MTPAVDRRDDYREQVDDAVREYGTVKGWTPQAIHKAQRICYRTIWAECDWRNLASARVPESLMFPNDGVGEDLDSVGLYQQRALYWGSTEGSMNPYVATLRFLSRPGAGMVQMAAHWVDMEEALVCQAVQRSQFDGITIDQRTGRPFPLAQNYKDREAQTNALDGDILYFTNGG